MPQTSGRERSMQRSPRRLRIQIYLEVLQAIDSTVRTGRSHTLYRVERITGLTHTRLKESLSDLRTAGFVEDTWKITPRGFAFIRDLSNTVIPILKKYDLWQGDDSPGRP